MTNTQNLPLQPNETLQCDFRERKTHNPLSPRSPSLRIVQWNIERGYKLELIIEKLRSIDADILCLQELDIDCKRSRSVNCFLEICKALKVKGVFAVEFVEIESKLRTEHSQGGGVHGNAVLSKFDFDFWTVVHKYHAFDWNNKGHCKGEPRRGGRVTVAANVHVPHDKVSLLCYSAHLEVFTGIYGRVMQFAEILRDARQHAVSHPHQIICGDMNTLGHSIARFSHHHCADRLRWRSFGLSESEWWHEYLLRCFTPLDREGENVLLKKYHAKHLPRDVIACATNPGFYDPFPVNEVTYSLGWGLYKAKLDWMLCRGVVVQRTFVDNHAYAASDHKLLGIEGLLMRDVRRIVPYAKRRVFGSKRNRLRNIVVHKGLWSVLVVLFAVCRWFLSYVRQKTLVSINCM